MASFEELGDAIGTADPFSSLGDPVQLEDKGVIQGAIEAVPERIFSSFDFIKTSLKSIQDPKGGKTLIPKSIGGVDIPESVRAPANVIAGTVGAPLGVLGVATSPLAALGAPVEQLTLKQFKQNRQRIFGRIDPRTGKPVLDPELRKEFEKLTPAERQVASFGGATVEGLAITGAGKLVPKKVPTAVSEETAVKIPKGKPSEIPSQPAKLPGRVTQQGPFGRDLSAQIQKDIKEGVEVAIREGTFQAQKGERVFRTVARDIAEGKIDINSWPKVRQKMMDLGNITAREADIALANEYLVATSEQGRGLARLSAIRRQLNKQLGDDAQKVLQAAEPEGKKFADSMGRLWRGVETTRRSLLVTQMATAARNAISQGGRFVVQVADDAMMGALRTATGKPIKESFRDVAMDGLALINRFSPTARKKLATALDNMPLAEAQLMAKPVGELVMGKVANALNIFNRTQEFFFRRIAFEAKFRTNLVKNGMKFDELTPEQFSTLAAGPKTSPFNLALEDSIKFAMEMTFAKGPQSKFAGETLRSLSHPLFTMFGNPFPRFWMNSLEFLIQHNPLGVVSMLRPQTIRQIASGNVEAALPAMSKAMVGTLMLAAAGAVRESDLAGERYFEVNLPQEKGPLTETQPLGPGGTAVEALPPRKMTDMRPFAPFSQYLFIWDQMFHPERVELKDAVEAAISINRIAGTGLMVVDFIRGQKPETMMKAIKTFGGLYFGGFTVPLRTAKDFVGQFVRKERTMGNIRQEPLLGPTKENIPFLPEGRRLPERRSPFTEGPLERGSPAIRQLTGLGSRPKTAVERESQRLKVDFGTIYPKTGFPEADALIIAEMGPITEQVLGELIKTPAYKRLTDPRKRLLVRKQFARIKATARKRVARENPELMRKVLLKGLDPDIVEIMKEQGIKIGVE